MIEPGDDLGSILITALKEAGITLVRHDIVVVAQKVVSKAENRYRSLRDTIPTPQAIEMARLVGKDERHVDIVLQESTDVVRYAKGVLIVEHRTGHVMANAGVDQSNISHADEERVLLLPEDPDAASNALKIAFDSAFSTDVAVIINDSFGRPFRNGVVGAAIGAAGLPSLKNQIGEPDLYGRPLQITEIAIADELAAAASLLMGQGAEGIPAVHIRGLDWCEGARPAKALLRPKHMDLFRADTRAKEPA